MQRSSQHGVAWRSLYNCSTRGLGYHQATKVRRTARWRCFHRRGNEGQKSEDARGEKDVGGCKKEIERYEQHLASRNISNKVNPAASQEKETNRLLCRCDQGRPFHGLVNANSINIQVKEMWVIEAKLTSYGQPIESDTFLRFVLRDLGLQGNKMR